MPTNMPSQASLVGVIADALDGWMLNFYRATRAVATAVVDGRVPESALTDIHEATPSHRGPLLAELADAAGFNDRDDEEALLIAVNAIIGLAAGSAIIGEEWKRGMVYEWYFDDAEQLAVHGLTIDAFRAATSALTIRQAAEVIVAAFAHLKNN